MMINKERNLLIFIPTVIIAAALVVAGILLIVKVASQNRNSSNETTTSFADKRNLMFEERLRNAAKRYGIPDGNVKTDIDIEERQVIITIFLPRGKLIEELVMHLFAAVENTEYRISEAVHIHKGRSPSKRRYVRMVLENKKRANEKIICEIIPTNEPLAETVKAAFLLSGLEKLSSENADSLLASGESINYILAHWIAGTPPIFNRLLRQVNPVLLEIPIEDSEAAFQKREYTIWQNDSKRKMAQKMKTLKRNYPEAVGFYARTGNLVLNSGPISQNFLQAIKEQKMAFIDGRRQKNRTARETADRLLVPYDTIFVSVPSVSSANLTTAEWESELKNLCEKTIKNKKSVIYISANDNFVEAFIKTLPHIKKKGIQLVPITDL